MQPYFFPYLGYFHLINAVDRFVFFDDVNFIKRGWINRNNFLINGQSHLITIPLNGASQNKLINEIETNLDEKQSSGILKTLGIAYKKAPYFDSVFPLVENVLLGSGRSIAELAMNSVQSVLDLLDIQKDIITSSRDHSQTRTLKGADRLIAICKENGCTNYLNPIGGKEIYEKEYFSDRGVSLEFVRPGFQPYDQEISEFIPGLSIIDLMMFNSADEIKEIHFNSYKLE